MKIGEHLRALRRKADLTLQQATDMMDWKHRSTLSKIELGKLQITTRDYNRLMRIYNAPNIENVSNIVSGLRDIIEENDMSLQVVAVTNNELEPDFRAGDHVMVDTKYRRVTKEGVYLIQPRNGDPELLRGRRHPANDKVMLSSGRPDAGLRGLHLELDDADVTVLGRVIWTMRRVG